MLPGNPRLTVLRAVNEVKQVFDERLGHACLGSRLPARRRCFGKYREAEDFRDRQPGSQRIRVSRPTEISFGRPESSRRRRHHKPARGNAPGKRGQQSHEP
jgi:hypothetical protein